VTPTDQCYTEAVPTTLPRHAITETPRVAAMLDDAEAVWPGVSRADLLRRLLEAGHAHVTDKRTADRRRRLTVIAQVSGSMPDVWPADAAQGLKDEWPA